MKKRKWSHKLEYFKDEDKEWRWRFVHRNGKILSSSEAYSSITMARRTATRLIDAIKGKKLRAITTKEEE